jgi:hypothetical protein
MGMAKSLRDSGEGSVERKAERHLLVGMSNLIIRKNNWKA